MGCGGSTDNAVKALTGEEVNGDEDDGGSKRRSCGDSAVSKGTTDSGVVLERDVPMLPGAVPRKLPPLTSEWITETSPGLLRQGSTAQEHPKSSEILEELLNQGIISIGQSRDRSSGAGEAYSIMLNDAEVVRRRPPARLESLKAKKDQTVTNIEDIEEKIRLVEERRKLREDQLKLRLRAKSAHVRVRAPVTGTEEDEDMPLSPVDPLEPALLQNIYRVGGLEEYEGESGGDNRASNDEMVKEENGSNQVEEFLIVQGDLESDLSFQYGEDKSDLF